MRTRTILSLAVAAALAGCGGGSGSGSGSSTPPVSNPSGGSGPTATQSSEQSISAANSFGSSVKTVASFEKGVSPLSFVASARAMSAGSACNGGFEFLVPDSNGDQNSTEAKYFYDSGCTQMARDVIRIFTPAVASGSAASETVAITESQFAVNNSSAIATKTQSVTLTAPSVADFDANGFASTATGFQRLSVDKLSLQGGSRIQDSDDELVMEPSTTLGQNVFCSDSASYNATGFAALNETFGSAGGVSGGSRTVNSDGSVTWTSTHAGTAYKGPINGLSIVTGSTPNTVCPASGPLTPYYTLAGGTATGAYTIPLTMTLRHGLIQSLTVTNATLASGNTLNISSSGSPTSATFITGTVTNGSTQIATFTVDAFGDGTLTVSKNGAQYVMQDWHVIR